MILMWPDNLINTALYKQKFCEGGSTRGQDLPTPDRKKKTANTNKVETEEHH